ncbi:MAG: FtsX-like permease family protein, partial [Alistipes sp.]|nr:FtsX-like permease family protein [Alistipes sp.]
FNMAAAVLIMVFDRIGMIGTLKALGMRTSSIRRIFLYRSALLFARGATWGNAVGLLLVALQALWEPIRLDPSGYMLSTLPVSIGWWIVWLNVGVMVVAVGVMVLPSMTVARISPDESLKYKL